jgi:hypothetical protein
MKAKRLLPFVVALVIVAVVWVCFNPPGRFGWSCYAFTTYNVLPRFVTDLQIRSDGAVRKVAKTHDVQFELVEWLLESQPEVLIIAIGWDGVAQPEERIRAIPRTEVRVLKNLEAIRDFNRLKREGRRVSIHFHSTC